MIFLTSDLYLKPGGPSYPTDMAPRCSSTTQSVVTTTTSTATASSATAAFTTPSRQRPHSASYSGAYASTPTLGPKRQRRLFNVEEIDIEDDIHDDILDDVISDSAMNVIDRKCNISWWHYNVIRNMFMLN